MLRAAGPNRPEGTPQDAPDAQASVPPRRRMGANARPNGRHARDPCKRGRLDDAPIAARPAITYRSRMGRHVHPVFRAVALWLGLVPFFLASLLAAGVMPARIADDTIALVICMDGTATEIAVDPATMRPVDAAPDDPDGDGDHRPAGHTACDWAAGQLAVALPAADVPQGPAPTPRVAPLAPVSTVIAVSRATGLPPSTGPPFRV